MSPDDEDISEEEIEAIYAEAYANEPLTDEEIDALIAEFNDNE